MNYQSEFVMVGVAKQMTHDGVTVTSGDIQIELAIILTCAAKVSRWNMCYHDDLQDKYAPQIRTEIRLTTLESESTINDTLQTHNWVQTEPIIAMP